MPRVPPRKQRGRSRHRRLLFRPLPLVFRLRRVIHHHVAATYFCWRYVKRCRGFSIGPWIVVGLCRCWYASRGPTLSAYIRYYVSVWARCYDHGRIYTRRSAHKKIRQIYGRTVDAYTCSAPRNEYDAALFAEPAFHRWVPIRNILSALFISRHTAHDRAETVQRTF